MVRMTGVIVMLATAALSACGYFEAPSVEDSDPYLAINSLLVKNACSNCHAADYMRVGPSMVDVAAVRGREGSSAPEVLAAKIMAGSQGSFGTAAMPPQKQVSAQQAEELAKAILALYKP
jgi:cytochrome c